MATVPYLNCPRPIRTVDCLITHLVQEYLFHIGVLSLLPSFAVSCNWLNTASVIQMILSCTSYPYEIISAPDTDPYSVNVTSIDANDVRHSVRALRILRLECGI